MPSRQTVLPDVVQVIGPAQPTIASFLGAFLLTAVCAAVGAAGGLVLIDRTEAPPLVRWPVRAGTLGAVVGVWYPALWVVAYDLLPSSFGPPDAIPVGGGFPAFVSAGVLGTVVLLTPGASTWLGSQPPDTGWRGPAAVALAVAVTCSVGFAVLLPVLFPALAV